MGDHDVPDAIDSEGVYYLTLSEDGETLVDMWLTDFQVLFIGWLHYEFDELVRSENGGRDGQRLYRPTPEMD
jgi:hypothetical protein